MVAYNGNYNPLRTTTGLIIPITLPSPAVLPGDGSGITFDITNLQGPAGQLFGQVQGLTIDATQANVASPGGTIFFPELNISRTWIGGVVQVIQVPPCNKFIFLGPAWTSGSIYIAIWNSQPQNEVQPAININLSGPVTISAGNVSVVNEVTVTPPGLVTNTNQITLPVGSSHTGIVGAGINCTLRGWNISAQSVQGYKAEGTCVLGISDASANLSLVAFFLTEFAITLEPIEFIGLTEISNVAIKSANGLSIVVETFGVSVVLGNTTFVVSQTTP